MKKFLFIILTASFSYAQIPNEETLLKEAARRNITTPEQALSELRKNGIDENQARALARQQGISMDEFLTTNFASANALSNSSSALPKDPDTSLFLLNDSIPPMLEEYGVNEDVFKADSLYFGYDIFDKNPFLEKEYLLGNIDEGYLVAPGDALRIIVFGNNSLELEAVVDRNGNINISNYGVFFAAGNTFKTLKKRLRTYLGKYFSGLLTTPQNTFLDVSLTQLNPTKVVVVGQVNSPGPQILTTQANPLAALYAAGGVKTAGSLREIRIYRNNKLLKTVDLYDYIVSGSLAKDITLTNNDIVFVPPRISKVFLKGEVKKTAYYELKLGENLPDLIGFSGGLPVSAARDRINILRIDPSNDASDNSDKSFITLNLNTLNKSTSEFDLYDGDQVEVLPLLDRVSNRVTIQGNVYSPGAYSLNKYSDLKSLIVFAARGIQENTYLDKVDVRGVEPTGEQTFASYNLADVLSGLISVPLKDRDDVVVYNADSVRGTQYVFISGYGVEQKLVHFDASTVNFLGQENIESQDTLSTSFSEQTSKFNEINLPTFMPNKGSLDNSSSETNSKRLEFSSELDGVKAEGDSMEKDDETGIVSRPWRKNMSLYDIVFENTVFESISFRENVFDFRIDVKSYDYQAKKYTTRPFRFIDESTLKGVFLKPFDWIIIYDKNVIENSENEVTVSGYVNSPNAFKIEKDMYVEDAILMAGGFSDYADQQTVFVNRSERDPKTDIVSLKYTIDVDSDYITGLKAVPDSGFVLKPKDVITVRKDPTTEELQLIAVDGEVRYPGALVPNLKQVSLSYILEEVGGLTDEALLESSYAERDGRILAIDFSSINKNKPIFQDGDKIVISKNFGSVTTEGALENPSVFSWETGRRAKYYLANSGGKLDKIGGKAFVVLSNGKTIQIGLFNNPKVYPGSKIIVNYKAKKESKEGKFFNDFSNVLGSITGVLTTILLVERL